MTETITIGTIMVQDSTPMPKSLVGAQSYSGGWSVRTNPNRSQLGRELESSTAQIDGRAMRSIFERKSPGVAGDEAGYLIHEWQALRDQARRMIT